VAEVTNDNAFDKNGNKAETFRGAPLRKEILGGIVCKFFGVGLLGKPLCS